MKLKTILVLSLTALTLFGAQVAHATRTYNSGDLYLGFSQTGNTTSDFAVNIGAGGSYRDALAPITLTLANLTSTLNSIFGTGWATNPNLNVQWTVFGSTSNTANNGDPRRVLYSTKAVGNSAPTQATTQTGTAGNMINAIDYYSNGLAQGNISNTTESSVPNGVIGAPGNANSVTTRAINGSPFGSVNLNQIYAPIATTNLELWRTPEGTSQTVGTSNANIRDLGFFSLSGNTLTFTPAAIPEPSTYALVGIALVGCGIAARNRRKAAALAR